MEIKNYINAINSYKSNIYESKKSQATKSENSRKMDTIEISHTKESSINSFKSALKKTVEANASSERINSLKSLILKGQYNISSESIAKAMIEI